MPPVRRPHEDDRDPSRTHAQFGSQVRTSSADRSANGYPTQEGDGEPTTPYTPSPYTPSPRTPHTPPTAGSAPTEGMTPVSGLGGPGTDTRRVGFSRHDLAAGNFSAGDVLFGKYEVVRSEPLGRGGMGQVWLVRHRELNRLVALKLPSAQCVERPAAWSRFINEARSMAKLTHQHAVVVHDINTKDGSIPYIEMEYVPGKSLLDVLEPREVAPDGSSRRKPRALPIETVVPIVQQLCDVLQVAHEEGIVHRDLKPSNIILRTEKSAGADGDPLTGRIQVKVLDFGIAKLIEAQDVEADPLTGENDILGTPAYMSPEQCISSRKADARSDIYSIGVILYQMVCGAMPFKGTPFQIITHQIHTPAPGFAEVPQCPRVPRAVEALIQRCLSKDPAQRPQTMRQLAEEFTAAAGGRAVAPRRPRAFPRRSHVTALLLLLAIGCLTAGTVAARKGWGPFGKGSPGPEIGGHEEPPKEEPPRELGGPPPRLVVEGRNYFLGSEAKGIYLPEGYHPEPGAAIDEEGYPIALLRNTDNERFLRLPRGQFTMGAQGDEDRLEGDNTPTHPVKLDGFYIQQYEVSNREFEEWVKARHLEAAVTAWNDDFTFRTRLVKAQAASHPATSVTWEMARKYAQDHNGYLPTEAQWEYAARDAGTRLGPLMWDRAVEDGAGELHRIVNIASVGIATCNTWRRDEVRADRTKAGVVNLAGNVREWTADLYMPLGSITETHNPSPPVPPGPAEIVVRGGSFNTESNSRYTTFRDKTSRDTVSEELGFRLVLRCPPRGQASVTQ